MKFIFLSIFLSYALTLDYEFKTDPSTGCFVNNPNKCYLDIYHFGPNMIKEMKTFNSCNYFDSNGNVYCLRDKIFEEWFGKHPMQYEINTRTGCWVSD